MKHNFFTSYDVKIIAIVTLFIIATFVIFSGVYFLTSFSRFNTSHYPEKIATGTYEDARRLIEASFDDPSFIWTQYSVGMSDDILFHMGKFVYKNVRMRLSMRDYISYTLYIRSLKVPKDVPIEVSPSW
jgi:hypothetical protein